MEDQNQNNINQADANNITNAGEGDKNVELETCQKQAEEYLNNWKRERADFVNYKKDEAKRVGEFIKFANEGLILELLETMDDLGLASKQIKNAGLDQVVKKLEELLKKYGVERISVGDPSTHSTTSIEASTELSRMSSGQASSGQAKFDPMYHEIVEGTEGEKIEEVRAGYTMHGRVIRPARVKIIK